MGFLICVNLCHSVAHSAFAKALRRDPSAFATARRCGKSHLVKAGQTLLLVPFALGSLKIASNHLSRSFRTTPRHAKQNQTVAKNRFVPPNTGKHLDKKDFFVWAACWRPKKKSSHAWNAMVGNYPRLARMPARHGN
jgi:hypothetical protein